MSTPLEHELATHARAMRQLARDLVGRGDADDVVQQVALQALQRPPHHGGDLRGWLARITRRLAMRHRRSQRRRMQHERQVPPRAPAPPPDALLEHQETLRRVTDALLALPVHYQRVLLLRYFEELEPKAIAERTGEALGTVKSRLARGLQLLRERLDAGKKESDWRAALGALFGLRRSGAVAAAAATGVMLMGTGVKLALGGVGAVLAVAAAWWCLQSPAPAVQSSAMHAQSPAQVVKAEAQTPSAAAAMAQRVAIESGTPPEPVATMRGRVVDEDHQPLAAAEVKLQITRRTEAGGWRPVGEPATTTAADGTFALALAALPDDRVHLQVRREGFCGASSWWDRAADSLDLGDIVLSTAITVQGCVVDEHGAPQAGAQLRLFRDPTPDDRRIGPGNNAWATSRDDGSFDAASPLAAGHGWLTVQNRSLLHGTSIEFILERANPRPRVEVVVRSVEPEGIAGIVVDGGGQPVADASVSCARESTGHGTLADGRFQVPIRAQHGPGPFELQVAAEGFQPLVTAPLPRGTRDARLVLQRAPGLELRVVEAESQQPVSNFRLMLLGPPPALAQLRRLAMHHYEGGIARLAGVSRGDFAVWVEADDPLLAPSTFVPLGIGDAATTAITVALPRRVVRRLRVEDADQQPLAGVDVELIDSAGQPLLRSTYAFPPMQRRWSGALFEAQLLQRGTTDANGELDLSGPPTPGLGLRLRDGGVALQVHGGISLADLSPLIITAERGGVWTGRLVPAGIAAALRAMAAGHEENQLGLSLWRADESLIGSHDPPLPIGADDTFRLDGIPSGTWQASLHIGWRRWHAATITVDAGQTLQRDLDVSPIPPTRLELQVFVDGKPFVDNRIHLLGFHIDGLTDGELTRTDGEGKVQIDTFGGVFECRLYVPVASGDPALVMTPPFTIASGSRIEHVLDVQLASATLRLLTSDGAPAADVPMQLSYAGVGAAGVHATQSDAEGRATLTHIAAGQHLLQVRPRSLCTAAGQAAFVQARGYEALQQAWIDLPPLVLHAGATEAPIEIRLPRAWDR